MLMSDFSPDSLFLVICSIHYSKEINPGTASLQAQIFQGAKSTGTGKVKFQRLLEVKRAVRCHGEGSWQIPTDISRLLKKSLSLWNCSACPGVHVKVTWEPSENLKVKSIPRLKISRSKPHPGSVASESSGGGCPALWVFQFSRWFQHVTKVRNCCPGAEHRGTL